MPHGFPCPACQQFITVNESLAGSSVSCPGCGATISVTGPEPILEALPVPEAEQIQEALPIPVPPQRSQPPPLPDDYETPRERAYRRERDYPREEHRERDYPPDDRRREHDYFREDLAPGWKTAGTGIALVRIGAAVFIFSLLGLVLFAWTMPALNGPGGLDNSSSLYGLFSLLSVLGMLACIILIFVGQGMCCATPAEGRASGLAISSILCHALAVLFAIFLIIYHIVSEASINRLQNLKALQAISAVAVLVIVGLAFTASILFLIFLRNVARFFRKERLAGGINGLLIYHCIAFGLSFPLLIFIGVLNDNSGRGIGRNRNSEGMEGLATLLTIILLIGYIVDLILFLSILARTRLAIGGNSRVEIDDEEFRYERRPRRRYD